MVRLEKLSDDITVNPGFSIVLHPQLNGRDVRRRVASHEMSVPQTPENPCANPLFKGYHRSTLKLDARSGFPEVSDPQ